MHTHLRIKNLAIAVEALSRVNGSDAVIALTQTMGLLQQELREAETEVYKPKLTAHGNVNPDDNIPF